MSARPVIAVALVILSAAAMTACATPAAAPSLSPLMSTTAEPPQTEAPSSSKDDTVPVSAPRHLSFPAAGIDGEVEEYTAAEASAEGGINPATLDTISWYSGIDDALPGTDATNTVYIFGHTWIEPAVFNGLVDVKIGDEATVTTATGSLTYAVEQIISMDKDDFTSDPTVSAIVPGRLVLVTCHRPEGWDDSAPAPDNTAVILHLVSSRAA